MKNDALAFWLKTPISSPHCVDRHRALSPCAARKAAFLSQKSCRERKRAESQNAVSLEKVDSRDNAKNVKNSAQEILELESTLQDRLDTIAHNAKALHNALHKR